jgi:hypothetical protein
MEDRGMEDRGMEDRGMEDRGMEDRGMEEDLGEQLHRPSERGHIVSNRYK